MNLLASLFFASGQIFFTGTIVVSDGPKHIEMQVPDQHIPLLAYGATYMPNNTVIIVTYD